ncbi:MAG: hypothetical protein AAFN93_26990 [Bacteroidota bacterium]
MRTLVLLAVVWVTFSCETSQNSASFPLTPISNSSLQRTSSSEVLTLSDFQNSDVGQVVRAPDTYQFQYSASEWGYEQALLFQIPGIAQVTELYVFPKGGIPSYAKNVCDKSYEEGVDDGKKWKKCSNAGNQCHVVYGAETTIIVICENE